MKKRTAFKIAISVISLIVLTTSLNAGSIFLPAQKIAVIYPPIKDLVREHSLEILIRFEIPDSLASMRINYSEVSLPFQVSQFADTTLFMNIYGLTNSWDENNVSWYFPWYNQGGDMDSVSAFQRYITASRNEIQTIDATQIVKDWSYRYRANYGFAISLNFPDGSGFRNNIDQILPILRHTSSLEIKFSR